MNSMIVGFSTTIRWNPISAAIRLAQQTPYSHAYVRFYSDRLDRWIVYQANRQGVHFISMESFLENEIILDEYRIDCTEQAGMNALQRCVSMAGRSYGVLKILGMLIDLLAWDWLGRRIPNPFRDNHKTEVCSEEAGIIANALGLPIDTDTLEVQGPRWLNQRLADWPGATHLTE